ATSSTLISLGNHLRNRQLLTTCAIGFCILFSLVAMFTYLTFYLAAAPFYLSTATLGSLFFVYPIGAVINPISGKWVSKYGHRNALAIAIPVSIIGVLLTLNHSLVLIITGLAISSTAAFISQTTASSYIGLSAQENRALAVGLYVTCYYFGGSAGATTPALFWQLGGWTACVLLVAAVQIIILLMAILCWSKKHFSTNKLSRE
ncbi:MAG: MFS transporter, partial [Acidobacteriota bacterium]